VAELQGLIFEEELIKEQMCFMVSLKQLLESVFLEVWICARLSHPTSWLLPPRCAVCWLEGRWGWMWSLSRLPQSSDALDCSSHSAQGVRNCGRFTEILLQAEI